MSQWNKGRNQPRESPQYFLQGTTPTSLRIDKALFTMKNGSSILVLALSDIKGTGAIEHHAAAIAQSDKPSQAP